MINTIYTLMGSVMMATEILERVSGWSRGDAVTYPDTLSLDRVGAVLTAPAMGAVFASPYAVEVFHCRLYKSVIIGEYSGFKVATARAFHTHSSPSEVGRAYIYPLAVDDYYLEVYARTEHPFKSDFKIGITIEVIAERRSRFFGMNEPDLHT